MRKSLLWVIGLAIPLGIVTLGGCALWRKDSAEADLSKNLLKAPEPPDFIRTAVSPRGLQYVKVQSFGIVNGLNGTGGVEPASEQRDLVLREMQKYDVMNPNEFIDSPETSIVMIEAVLPPGSRRNDPLDLVVRTSSRPNLTNEQTSSLKGGWLMPARIAYTQVMQDGKPRSSDPLAIGTGPIVLREQFEAGSDPQLLLEGRILGGGRVQKDSNLELRIRSNFQHVAISKRFADVINRRFHFFDGTQRRGIANAKEDDLITIEIPERYRHNVHRLMAVIGALSSDPDIARLQERLPALAKQLAEPTTAQDAALQLEGIGHDGVSTLLVGLGSSNPEIRFYAAEALSYLDHEEAIDPLVELTRDQPAFRFQTLLALSGMPQRRAVEGLRSLMDETSTEARCGAFDAIRRRHDANTAIYGQQLTDGASEVARLYDVPSAGGSLVSLSLRRSPDIVIFGGVVPVQLTQSIVAGNGLLIVPNEQGGLQINRILTGKPDARVHVPADVGSVCAGIAMVGGGYGGIVECLRMMKQQEAFAAQLAIDVLPQPLREYHRDTKETGDGSGSLTPSAIDPPAAKPQERAWYDPRDWFSSIDLSANETVS